MLQFTSLGKGVQPLARVAYLRYCNEVPPRTVYVVSIVRKPGKQWNVCKQMYLE